MNLSERLLKLRNRRCPSCGILYDNNTDSCFRCVEARMRKVFIRECDHDTHCDD
jgi:hypothetical protein